MFAVRKFLLSLAILSCLLVLTTQRAYACSCIGPGSAAEELERSTAVFAGTVVDVADANRGPIISSADPIAFTFQVTRVWKGPIHTTLIISSARGGASCGYEFEVGREYLVYADGTETHLQASLCSRTQPLSVAGEDLKALGEGERPTPEPPELDETPPLSAPIGLCGLMGVGAVVAPVLVIGKRRSRHSPG